MEEPSLFTQSDLTLKRPQRASSKTSPLEQRPESTASYDQSDLPAKFTTAPPSLAEVNSQQTWPFLNRTGGYSHDVQHAQGNHPVSTSGWTDNVRLASLRTSQETLQYGSFVGLCTFDEKIYLILAQEQLGGDPTSSITMPIVRGLEFGAHSYQSVDTPSQAPTNEHTFDMWWNPRSQPG